MRCDCVQSDRLAPADGMFKVKEYIWENTCGSNWNVTLQSFSPPPFSCQINYNSCIMLSSTLPQVFDTLKCAWKCRRYLVHVSSLVSCIFGVKYENMLLALFFFVARVFTSTTWSGFGHDIVALIKRFFLGGGGFLNYFRYCVLNLTIREHLYVRSNMTSGFLPWHLVL